MIRHLHLDPFSGVAGDMFLGLLLDLGCTAAALESIPRRLGLEGVEVRCGSEQRGSLSAGRVRVIVRGWEELPGSAHRDADSKAVDATPGRGLADVLAVVRRADLPDSARGNARRAFEALFRAEGKAHGQRPEEVHLHEAGADDALVDIAGTALGLVELGVGSVSCSVPLPLGGGMIHSAHGLLPVPGPAVAELLTGVPVTGGPIDAELITPTGAALLRTLVGEFRPVPPMTVERVGHGAGSRNDAHLPNVLRGLLGTTAAGPLERTIAILEATLDDILPQDVPPLVERLLAAGARDAWVTPIQMKKGRPGFNLTVICDPGLEPRLADLLLHDSPTLGVRRRRETRWEWARDVVTVQTPWGPVRVKRALDGAGRPLRGQPEFDDCRRAADSAGVSVDEVRRRARQAFDENGGAAGAPSDPDNEDK